MSAGASLGLQVTMLALRLGSRARDVGVAPPGRPLKSSVSLCRHPAPLSPPSSLAGLPGWRGHPHRRLDVCLGRAPSPLPPSQGWGFWVHQPTGSHRLPAGRPWVGIDRHPLALPFCPVSPPDPSLPRPGLSVRVLPKDRLRAVSAFRHPDWTAVSRAAPGGREGSSELEHPGWGGGTAGRPGSLSVQGAVGGVRLRAGSGGVGGEPLSAGCHGRGSSEQHHHRGAEAGRRCRAPEKEVARGSQGWWMEALAGCTDPWEDSLGQVSPRP